MASTDEGPSASDLFAESLVAADELAEARRTIKRLQRRIVGLERDLHATTSVLGAEVEVPRWTTPKRRPRALTCAPVLLLSDWHFGEVVDPREVDGANAFDDEIAERRWSRVIDETPEMLRRHLHGYRFEFLVVGLLGDMLSGDIHEELARTNTAPVPEVITTWVPRIVAGLRHLADETGVERVVVPCVDGNHDRTGRRLTAKRRATSSWAWLIYQWVAAQLADDHRFHFMVSRSSEVWLPVFDTRILFVHGDGARGGHGIGGIWPPIMRHVAKLQQSHQAVGRPVDLVCMGHWHQWVVGKGFVVNGSGKGWDEFAKSMSFPPETPQQALFAVTPDRGVILHTAVHAE